MIRVSESLSIHSVVQNAIKYTTDKHEKNQKIDTYSTIFVNAHQNYTNTYIMMTIEALLSKYPYEQRSPDVCNFKHKLVPHIEHVMHLLERFVAVIKSREGMIDAKLVIRCERDLLLKALVYLLEFYNEIGNFESQYGLYNKALFLAENYYGNKNLLVAKLLYEFALCCIVFGKI